MKLLLVDSDMQALGRLTAYLRTEGFAVEAAEDIESAKINTDIYNYSCVVAELKPEANNMLELIKELKMMDTGVIVVSSNAVTADKIGVLEAGADDFISKPYDPAEIKARIRSLMRRKVFNDSQDLEYGCVRVGLDNHKVYVNNRRVGLTRKEYELLVYLLTDNDKLLTREMIAERLWGEGADVIPDVFSLIYTHVKNIRKKLSKYGCPDIIETVYGKGYRVRR